MVDIPETAQDVLFLNDDIAFYIISGNYTYMLWVNDKGVIDKIEEWSELIPITEWLQSLSDRLTNDIIVCDDEIRRLEEKKSSLINEQGVFLDAILQGKRYNIGVL